LLKAGGKWIFWGRWDEKVREVDVAGQAQAGDGGVGVASEAL
jgi:hypothetical protein